jgi:hypothetical protein
VTERVSLKVARLEGSGDSERPHTLATEAFLQELGKVPVAGSVTVLREQRLDERGRVGPPSGNHRMVGTGNALGTGWPEADLAVEPGGILATVVMQRPGGEMQARMWPTQRPGRAVGGVRFRRPRTEAVAGRSHPWHRRGLRRDRDHRRRIVGRGEGFSGGRADIQDRNVDRAPCGKIHEYHPRPRARGRAAGLPALTDPQRNQTDDVLRIVYRRGGVLT